MLSSINFTILRPESDQDQDASIEPLATGTLPSPEPDYYGRSSLFFAPVLECGKGYTVRLVGHAADGTAAYEMAAPLEVGLQLQG